MKRDDCRESRRARIALETLLCLGRMTVIEQGMALHEASRASSEFPEPEWIEGSPAPVPVSNEGGAR